ncbi:MAG: hypothetical protein IKP95_12795 [Ruminococcus sp.]|nr:hypothetical protein [Ruminococcus sp.]MBR6103298.1 hypothetical protein [Ruminococcus sp.]
MSVPLSERGISKKKYYDYALKLDDKIVGLLIRDFGLKTICKDLNVFTHKAKMNELDKSLFNKLCEVYHLNVETAYPYWLIDHYRTRIMKILEDLIANITTAYSIFANSEREFFDRRHYQWLAISNCEMLLQTMQCVIRQLPVDAEKYMEYVDMIQEEIELLKNWKKSENKILKAIREKEAES